MEKGNGSAATRIEPRPHGKGAEIFPLVIADLEGRAALGKAKYGETLRAMNGRDPLVDAYQEVLDLCLYLRQELEERKALSGLIAAGAFSREERVSMDGDIYQVHYALTRESLLRRLAEDPLLLFVTWNIKPSKEETMRTTARTAYQHYLHFCRDNKLAPASLEELDKKIGEVFPTATRLTASFDNEVSYYGLSLVVGSEPRRDPDHA